MEFLIFKIIFFSLLAFLGLCLKRVSYIKDWHESIFFISGAFFLSSCLLLVISVLKLLWLIV